jgi:hypothetical protein
MKITSKELMDKLGVGGELSPYETMPWFHYDEDEGIHCSAEVRMESSGKDIEAELQFMYDDPPEGKNEVEPITLIKLHERKDGQQFDMLHFTVQGESRIDCVYDWEMKACNFFRACVREIKAGRVPDIDMLLDRELREGGIWGDKMGDGSSKSPKINTNQLLYDMKKGGQGF